MNLFIKHLNHNTIDHPVTEENLKLVYPGTTFPDEWKKFVRVQKPEVTPGIDYIFNGYAYNLAEDYFYDEWLMINVPLPENTEESVSITDD
jgi:hypothetical protein